MKRSKFKNKANKSGKEEDKNLYNIQRNKVSRLNNKLKKKTYFKENLPKGNNLKDFWNYCKRYFTPEEFVTMTGSYLLKISY